MVINGINQKTLKSSKVGHNAGEIENLVQGLQEYQVVHAIGNCNGAADALAMHASKLNTVV